MEYAVCSFFKTQLSTATLANQSVEAHIFPPPDAPQEQTSGARVYIWPFNTDSYRKEMGGFLWYEYRPMQFLLRQTVDPVESDMEQFLATGDALRQFISDLFAPEVTPARPGNQEITDPSNGAGSFLQIRDERVNIRHRLPRGMSANLPITLEAMVSVVLYEQNQLRPS